MKITDMPTFEQVLDEQLADPPFRAEWDRTQLARQVANELVRYRARHNLTQAGLAEQTGLTEAEIVYLEAEEEPSLAALARLSETLELSFQINIDPAHSVVRIHEHPGPRGSVS
ncbi:helix-turn-helix transcriptional regulator [Protofrankia sp. BMG5.30]|uniref:helix-turn-helix transcriptional regulator n=2 Tax=Protofrankia TaxID=2994361 RepID=UPI0011155841|nr:helix-turn-helix transcriptional regulator [Protofrankia sp. BMG5.30]